MAKAIPSNLDNVRFSTAGERKLLSILKNNLDDEILVRYEMIMGERHFRPDFVILDPKRGVIICEVKDWTTENVVSFSKDEFLIRYGNKAPEPDWNFNTKCETYQGTIRKRLMAKASLKNQEHELLVPVDYFLVFTNITQDDFVKRELNTVIPIEKVVFKSELLSGGKEFIERYNLIPTLEIAFTEKQTADITSALFPDLVLPRSVADDGFIKSDKNRQFISIQNLPQYLLSEEQEEAAKNMGDGTRILEGIAGTGKTLVLLYRAKLLASNKEKPPTILILCWNTALANYMNQMYAKFPIKTYGTVKIMHFSMFLRELLNHNNPFPYYDDWDFDENLSYKEKQIRKEEAELQNLKNLQERLEKQIINEEQKFDAVYVDEAQDFRKEWIEFIFSKMLRGSPEKRNLIIAADNAQKIYKNVGFEFSELSFNISEKRFLKSIYRNSARVWIFSAFLLKEKAIVVKKSPGKLKFAQKGGYDPALTECKDLNSQIEHIIQTIKKLSLAGNALNNVLILYPNKNIAERLVSALEKTDIEFDWITAGSKEKREFDWNKNSVKISTVHSAKGMDSPIVFIISAESFRRGTEEDKRLLYVGMTRAREYLEITYSGNGGLVQELKTCQEQYEKYYFGIIELENQ